MTHNDLKAYTEQAIEAVDTGNPLPTIVHLPPKLRGRKTRIIHDRGVTKALPDVRGSIVRIQEEVDPIGVLIAIANGMPLSKFVIDKEGNVAIAAEWPGMKERMQAIKALADRVHPRMSVTGRLGAGAPDDDKPRSQALIEGAERDAGN